MKNLFRSGLLVLFFLSAIIAKAQVPILSSYPSATGVIFLDFDGQTVANTSWNTNGPIYCGASGMTNSQIIEIFNRVAEDYRPFNVNITTDSTVYFAAPATMRTRIILTVTSSWYGSAGGVSFVGSFTWGDNTPAFVFSALLNYNTKNVAEAASHEAGHTLGLYHQAKYDASCTKLTDYNLGQGTGEIGWAPIMGAGYYQNLTLWNNGPNSFGCANYQNDLDVITGSNGAASNGFSYRTDDYASTFATASTVPFNVNVFNASGVIEKNTDQDMFKFVMPSAAELTIDAIPYNVGTGDAGSDLDLQVSLYNSSQTLLNVYNPGTLLNSVIDTLLGSGTYYLKVEGKGNVYAPNYASLGSYSLQGTMNINTPLPVRRLELHGAINGEKHDLNWLIDADEQVTNQTLEVSTDGRTFHTLTQTDINARSYSYIPNTSGTLLYRLNVTFDNGRQNYSNIVTLKQNGISLRPQLAGNLITSGSIMVNSPGNFNYSIFDFSGKIITKGLLTNGTNTINAATMISGMYMIRFDNGQQQWADKFARQ